MGMNPIGYLRRLWGQSIQRQLTWSFSLAALLTILGAGYLLLSLQKDFLYSQGTKNAFDLAQTLSFSSVSWVLADDVVGLQEVLKGTSKTTDLKFAVVLSPRGEVLASTISEHIGKFFGDATSQRLLGSPAEPQTLLDEDNLIDVAVPIKVGNAFIGWVRVELTRDTANRELWKIAAAGLAIAIFLVMMISLVASGLARRLTRGLDHLVSVAIDAEHGRAFQREDIARLDEVGVLARHLYQMLDAVEAEKKAKFESEARFRRLVKVVPIPLSSVSKEGVILDYNDSFVEVFGYTHEDIPTIADWWRLAYPDEDYRRRVLATWNDALGTAMETGQNIQPNEYRVTCRNGDVRVMEIAGVVIGDDILAIFIDITERKQNEEALRRYKDHLEEEVQQRTADLVLARNAAEAANKAKSVFLANMSHELRTPLNAILGFSNVMRNDAQLRDDQRLNLDIINRSGGHLLTLVNDVLEMAKIEAGRVQLNNVAFDLGSMIRDVADMLGVRAKEKGLRLLIDQSSSFPRYIVSDEAHLRQILINLAGNAIKFTAQGGVTLRLGVRENSISHLLIEVEDSGPGIAPENQQRIFEPFEQLDEQGANKGTGLGLTITRQFVKLMGGSISLKSTLGKGSVFIVDLPLQEAKEADVVMPQPIEKSAVVGLAAGQPNYRILIVEDQLENQLLLTKLMESVGFQVKVAENGQRGVELFQSWQPHLIWMDRRMPVMDGQEATRIIRSLDGGQAVKIVAVTASVFLEQRTELIEAGMDDFVRKPYRFNEIYDCMVKQLGVRFIYEGVAEPAEDVAMLTAEMLLALPEPLRCELKSALESLEGDRIRHAIQQVGLHDRTLQKILSRLADNFDYPPILRILDAETSSAGNGEN
jgi:PAS domain S-box-containing protein